MSLDNHPVIGEDPHPSLAHPSPRDENERRQAVVGGNTAFAFALYERLQGSIENIVLAPLSLSTVLAPVYAGARGNTERQMAEVLRFPLGQEQLHPAFALLQARLDTVLRAGEVEWNLANALWPQANYSILPEFLRLATEQYSLPVTPVDYLQKSEEARETINAWVAQKTGDKIRDLIKKGVLNAMVRLVVTNAIYFKGNWASPFDPQRTQEAPFWVAPGAQVSVPMMVQTCNLHYAQLPGLQLLELPYAGEDLAMLLVLPDPGKPEPSLVAETWQDWLQRLEAQVVQVWLPRFRVQADFRLNDTLKALGLVNAFDRRRADFRGITGTKDLYLAEVLHQAFLEVNEAGSEAAGASAAILTEKSMPLVFRADHPFLFMIYERGTGSLVFMGRLANPGGW